MIIIKLHQYRSLQTIKRNHISNVLTDFPRLLKTNYCNRSFAFTPILSPKHQFSSICFKQTIKKSIKEVLSIFIDHLDLIQQPEGSSHSDNHQSPIPSISEKQTTSRPLPEPPDENHLIVDCATPLNLSEFSLKDVVDAEISDKSKQSESKPEDKSQTDSSKVPLNLSSFTLKDKITEQEQQTKFVSEVKNSCSFTQETRTEQEKHIADATNESKQDINKPTVVHDTTPTSCSSKGVSDTPVLVAVKNSYRIDSSLFQDDDDPLSFSTRNLSKKIYNSKFTARPQFFLLTRALV